MGWAEVFWKTFWLIVAVCVGHLVLGSVIAEFPMRAAVAAAVLFGAVGWASRHVVRDWANYLGFAVAVGSLLVVQTVTNWSWLRFGAMLGGGAVLAMVLSRCWPGPLRHDVAGTNPSAFDES